MKMPSIRGVKYPHSILIEGSADAHSQLYSVIESFKDTHLLYKHKDDDRTLSDIISHALCTQYCWYTQEIVLENKTKKCACKAELTIEKTLESIQKNLERTSRKWKQLSEKELQTEIKTEWGQIMSKELALFQSIEHMMYHVGEICYIAGLGAFYKGTLG